VAARSRGAGDPIAIVRLLEEDFTPPHPLPPLVLFFSFFFSPRFFFAAVSRLCREIPLQDDELDDRSIILSLHQGEKNSRTLVHTLCVSVGIVFFSFFSFFFFLLIVSLPLPPSLSLSLPLSLSLFLSSFYILMHNTLRSCNVTFTCMCMCVYILINPRRGGEAVGTRFLMSSLVAILSLPTDPRHRSSVVDDLEKRRPSPR